MTFTSLIKYSKTSIENADLNLRAEYIVNLMEKEIRQSSKVYLVNDKIVFYKKENLSIDKQGGFLIRYEYRRNKLHRIARYFESDPKIPNINYFLRSSLGKSYISGGVDSFQIEVLEDLILIDLSLGDLRKLKMMENNMQVIDIGGENH